jgi:hypothetical protein
MYYKQLIPAPDGLYAVYKVDGGTELRSPAICLALDKDGHPVILDFDPQGLFVEADEASNFDRFEWEGK